MIVDHSKLVHSEVISDNHWMCATFMCRLERSVRSDQVHTMNIDRDVSCQYGRLVTTPTSGRYHVRRQTEEFEATTTSPIMMTSLNRVTICPNYSRLQPYQQHWHQQIPSVSAVVSATRKTPSLQPSIVPTPKKDGDETDFTRNSRPEQLLPVPVYDPHRFRPFGTDVTTNGGVTDEKRQSPSTISTFPSPVAAASDFLTFVQSGPL